MIPTENTPTQASFNDKKRRTIMMWLRVIAVMFATFFFLSQCAMSKPKMKAAVIESCVKNVPFSSNWQQALHEKQLSDPKQELIQQYCVCMWDAPLQKLSDKQLQSFSKLSAAEQLQLLGGEQAFSERDQLCLNALK